MTTISPSPSPDGFDRRQKRLLVVAWSATVLPLIAFAYLTWGSWQLNKNVQEMRAEVSELNTRKETLLGEIEALQKDLAAQHKSTKHYRDVAGIRIQFYRESDRAVVEQALVKLGFRVDTNLGKSKLIDAKPNTIAFGKLVAEQDLREIAVALVEAGFPLRRITPAVKQPDAQLIQIYASAESASRCGLLTVAQLRAGSVCGPLNQ